MRSSISKSGCFWFGVIVNFALLCLTIYTAQSGKPFAVWVSLLIAFLLAFIFVVTIALGHLGSPSQRGNNYILPLSEEEIELQRMNWSPVAEERPRPVHVERPLPPIPVRRLPGRDSPYPTLVSPLSDPFIVNNTGSGQDYPSLEEGGRCTVRLVPESSVASRI